MIRASACERQGQYQQAEEDFWRAVWSGNSKAGGYYGLARLAARNGNFDAGLDFCQQSLRASPTNQEVLCLHNLLLVFVVVRTTRVCSARAPRDYPLNATLWWLNWFDGRSESALAQWRGLCQGRDINALMTAGQLINWGMPTLAAEMLNALDCQRTLPLYLQASLLPKAERGELVAKAIDVFPQFVASRIRWKKWRRWRVLKSAGLLAIYWPASTTTNVATTKPLPYGNVE